MIGTVVRLTKENMEESFLRYLEFVFALPEVISMRPSGESRISFTLRL